MKKNIFISLIFCATLYGMQTAFALGTCDDWNGQWIFNYGGSDNQTVDLYPAAPYAIFTCVKKGTRTSDSREIMLAYPGNIDPTMWAYYETYTPSMSTPYDRIVANSFTGTYFDNITAPTVGSPPPPPLGSGLTFGRKVGGSTIQPPANDDFDSATPIAELPFSDSIDTRGATADPSDPVDCYTPSSTVWYSFSPSSNMQVLATTSASDYSAPIAVYTGTRDNFSIITCNYPCVTFDAEAGKTYFFMVGDFYGVGGNLVFNFDVTPPPLTIDQTVQAINQVNKAGVATISGTVTCSQPANVYLYGQVKQRAGRLFIRGEYSINIICEDTTPWTTQVEGYIGPFLPGLVTVTSVGYGYTSSDCGSDAEVPEVTKTVWLRMQRK